MTLAISKLVAARIPPTHRTADFDLIPEVCPHKDPLEQWLRTLRKHVNAGDGLILYGDHSTGKSACAAIIAKFALAYGMEAFWIRHGELLNIRHGGEMFDELYSMYDWCQSVKLLIIDEVYIPKDGAKMKAEFEVLLRWRVDHGLSTIVTMNQKKSQVEQNDGKAILAIFDEAFKYWPVRGHDFRKDKVK